ncbi:MAG: D-alanine--D-alanine ligase [Candidatus Moranbacteria bacterium]|nr:D-alanine--D-alanine ligase [Candidatus Moranbacteria bacterium]
MKHEKKRKIRVAVLCGGSSSEREVSIRTGHQVTKALPADRYVVSTVSIDENGAWFFESGTERQSIEPKQLSQKTDVVFIALHGKFGEDGTVQGILEEIGVPYTGSGVSASELGMDKAKCSEKMKQAGIPIPDFFLARKGSDSAETLLEKARQSLRFPFVVKPNASGSSVGVSIVHSAQDFPGALLKAWDEDDTILIQRYISGREYSCGILGNTGKTKLEALPVIEIKPKTSEFFDYTAKYTPNASKEICPAPLSEALTNRIQEFALRAHTALGCEGLTRSDFLIDSDGNVFFLEINTIPGQTETSLCPQEALVAGMTFSAFLEKQVELAFSK